MMKPGRTLISALLISLTSLIYGQESFTGGLRLGIVATQINGDGFAGFNKLGIASGAYVGRPINDLMDWKMELLYIQKGSRQQPDAKNGNTFLRIALDYIEVPISVSYDYKKIEVEAYLAGGVLINQKVSDQTGTLPAWLAYNRFEFSGGVGLNAELAERAKLNIRLGSSILPMQSGLAITSVGIRGGSFNRVLLFGMLYDLSKK